MERYKKSDFSIKTSVVESQKIRLNKMVLLNAKDMTYVDGIQKNRLIVCTPKTYRRKQ